MPKLSDAAHIVEEFLTTVAVARVVNRRADVERLRRRYAADGSGQAA